MPCSRNRRGGRPKALSDAHIRRAKAMLADLTITVEEVAQLPGTTMLTLY